MQPKPSFPSSASASSRCDSNRCEDCSSSCSCCHPNGSEEANSSHDVSFMMDGPAPPSSSAATMAVYTEITTDTDSTTTSQELQAQLADKLIIIPDTAGDSYSGSGSTLKGKGKAKSVQLQDQMLPMDIWKEVIEILGADLRYHKARNQRSELKHLVQTLCDVSLVSPGFRYFCQSELFKNVRFHGCFDEATQYKFFTIVQPHIGHHIQVLRLSANTVCTMSEGRHMLNYDVQVGVQDPMGDCYTWRDDDAVSDHGSFVSEDSGIADEAAGPAWSQAFVQVKPATGLQAVARSRILSLFSVCRENLRKVEIQGRLVDTSRDAAQMQHDFSPNGRNLAESVFLSVIIEALSIIRLPSLSALSFVLNTLPQPFRLDRPQHQHCQEDEADSCNYCNGAYDTIMEQNLVNIRSLNLSVRSNVSSVGPFVAKTAPSATDLILHMGAGQDGDARWLGMNPQAFRPTNAIGIEGVRNLTINSLLIRGSLSNMLQSLTSMRILIMLDIQLVYNEDRWCNVFDTCADLKKKASLGVLEVRWGGYRYEGPGLPPPFGTCSLWTYEQTLGMDGANSYGRALCTHCERDENAFEDVMELFHGPRHGVRSYEDGSEEEDDNPGAETLWVVCIHEHF